MSFVDIDWKHNSLVTIKDLKKQLHTDSLLNSSRRNPRSYVMKNEDAKKDERRPSDFEQAWLFMFKMLNIKLITLSLIQSSVNNVWKLELIKV